MPPPLATGGWPAAVDGPDANGAQDATGITANSKKKGATAATGTTTARRAHLLPPAASEASSFAKSFCRLRSVAGDSYLDPKSLKVVRLLGEGGFAKVELCELLTPHPRLAPPPEPTPLDAAAAAGNLSPPASFRRASYDASSEASVSATGRPLIAVKRLHPHLFSTPKELDAFSGEIRLLKQLTHPNIVAFVGAGALEDAKSAYIAQEYVGGGTLGQLIVKQCMQGGGGEQVGAAATAEGDPTGATFRRRSSGVFASFFSSQAVYQAGDAVDIMLQVAKALNYLHTRSPMVLHRDVKPDNVLLAAPLPTAAAAARRRRRLALLANNNNGGGNSGLSEAAAAAAVAAGNVVAPSDASATLGPGVAGAANNGGAQRNRSLPGRRPSFTSLTGGGDPGPIEPEREWVAKLTDFGLSTSVGARRQKEQIQRIASAALVRSRSSAVSGGATTAGGASSTGANSVASSAGGSSAFIAVALSALRAEAASPGGVRAGVSGAAEAPAAQPQGAATLLNLAPTNSGELELDWNLRIQSRTMVAPSFRMGHGGGPGGAGGGGTLAPVGEAVPPSSASPGGGGGGASPLPEPCEHGSYELTRNTGSLMYMAPEVFKGQPYNEKADVFSWGLVLRESLAAYLTSFAMGSVAEIEMYASRVSNGFRPPLDPRWPESLRTLISDCWHQDPRKRPSMAEVVKRLERIVRELPLLPRVGRAPPNAGSSEAGGGALGGGSEAGGGASAKGPALCGCVVQ